MSRTYRIKAVSNSSYIVQEPFLWFFWSSPFYKIQYTHKFITTFSTLDEAQAALDAYIARKSAAKKHVSQKPLYVTYSREWL